MKTLLPFLISLTVFATAHATPQESLQDLLNRLGAYQRLQQQIQTQKPDPQQMQALLANFQLSDQDKADFQSMQDAANGLDALTWTQIMAQAQLQGGMIAYSATHPEVEELYTPGPSDALPGGYIKGSNGVMYSQTVTTVSSPATHPLIIGGGFPFNQTQFQDFNKKVAAVTQTVELYDPICTGMSVLYDAVQNNSQGCAVYKPVTGLDLLRDELTMRAAYADLSPYLANASLTTAEQAIFRATRMSFRGITLYDQAKSLKTLTSARGYTGDNQAILTGLSYGGLIVAKAGAMFPGTFKALVMFSPGTENPAHQDTNADASAILESTWSYRRILRDLVEKIAMSPRYDAYLPKVLANYNANFRASLQTKMLGELDLDIQADMARITDRTYIVTGGKDATIDPLTQIAAMRVMFAKHPGTGTYVLVPSAGHAQWGNPDQSNEPAVLHVLNAVEGETLLPQHVYAYDDQSQAFKDLGEGNAGLDAATKIVNDIKAQAGAAKP